MPLGVDISADGVVSFGASASRAANGGDGGGGGGGSGGSGSGGIGSVGKSSSGNPAAGTENATNAPGSSTSAPKGEFSGSPEPASPGLTEQREQDLISRGWQ